MKTKGILFSVLTVLFVLAGYGFTTLTETETITEHSAPIVRVSILNFLPTPMLQISNEGTDKTVEENTGITAPFLGNSYVAFKEAIAFKESRGNYTSINTLGYMGKYQFGIGTLELVGIRNAERFLNNPELQEKAFDANVARNKWILRKDVKRYVGTTIQGILITESGMLAAAHLAGAGNVKKYVRSNGAHLVADAYGTALQDYLTIFAGYEVEAIRLCHGPKVNNMYD
jgi:hypothetical protein